MLSKFWRIAALLIVALLGLPLATAQETEEVIRIAVSLKGQRNPKNAAGNQQHKLSPELRALQRVEGALVGRTARGEAVITTTKAAARQLVTESETTGVDFNTDVEEWTPIDRLILSYDKKAPSIESLDKIGLELIEDHKPGTFVIVRPKKGTQITGKTADALNKLQQISRAYPSHRVKVSPPKDGTVEPAAGAPRTNSSSPRIESPQSSRSRSSVTPTRPNDRYFDRLWGMQKINAPLAWSVNRSSPVIVGVIDTGIDYEHPDLQSNIWTSPRGTHGFSALTGREDPMDDNGHGTHCAGTIAAVADNNLGVAGVTWNVKVMGLKFLDASGEGYDVDAIKCIDFALDHGVKVLSNSWGGGGYQPETDEAIQRALTRGTLFIAAAGNDYGRDNDSADPNYPSSYERDNVIAVMSIDPNGQMSEFSNFGQTRVHLAAPGRDILSTYLGRRYKSENGTSMATPHVAGAAALAWGHPRLQSSDWRVIKQQLLANVAPQSNLRALCSTGGVLDLQFLADLSTPPVVPPVVQPDPSNQTPVVGNALALVSTKFDEPIAVVNCQNLVSVRVQLTEPSDVWLRADTSVTSNRDVSDASMAFLDEEPADERWAASARHFSLTAGRWTSVSGSFVVNLPAGTHDLYWKLWDEDDNGATLTCNAGTLSVIAVRPR